MIELVRAGCLFLKQNAHHQGNSASNLGALDKCRRVTRQRKNGFRGKGETTDNSRTGSVGRSRWYKKVVEPWRTRREVPWFRCPLGQIRANRQTWLP